MTESLWPAVLAGMAAGLGVAMPLGAIGALLLRMGLTNGFWVAGAGAAGVATTDVVYCAVATLTGGLFADFVQAYQGVFLVASGALVLVIGVWQLARTLRRSQATVIGVRRASAIVTFARFVALTAINPLTLMYFIALGAAVSTATSSPAGPIAFVLAVGLSSFAWQLLLAGIGAFCGRLMSATATRVIGIAASVVIATLGIMVIVSGLARPAGK
ncbi:LysE family transporter [Labedella phragmitis]|nr:LysE family transporter [Labedella phragmitis]